MNLDAVIPDMLPGLQEGQDKMSKSDPSSSIFMEDEEVCFNFIRGKIEQCEKKSIYRKIEQCEKKSIYRIGFLT